MNDRTDEEGSRAAGCTSIVAKRWVRFGMVRYGFGVVRLQGSGRG